MRHHAAALLRTFTILVFFVSLPVSVNGTSQIKATIDTISKENELFWVRFLRTNGDLSTPVPTPEETCIVDVTLRCASDNDVPCNEVLPPPLSCANRNPIPLLTFTFQGGLCNHSNNQQGSAGFCKDDSISNFSDPVFVFCITQDGKSLDVSPKQVQPSGTFTVTSISQRNLPIKVDCQIVALDNSKIQQNVIDTSGDVPLNLQDTFGAFKLESCSQQSCIETINYGIDISNDGFSDTDIKQVSFTFNGKKDYLLNNLEENPIGPGNSTTLEVKKEINICTNEEFSALVAVRAKSSTGGKCEDADKYTFTVPASTASPVSLVKTNEPTYSPTAEPTPSPTNEPTYSPTTEPTIKPTTSPTNTKAISTITPTVASSTTEPTNPQTEALSDVPSDRATSQPTISSALSKSNAPTLASSDVATQPPTLKCLIGIDVSCSVATGPNTGKLCDTPGVEVQPCLDRPTQSTMRYNGGNCDQSENRQLLKFSCEDFFGGPTTSESAYIVVKDSKGKNITYFEGTVNVGDNYVLSDDDKLFTSDMTITIYGSSDLSDSNLLQRVTYSSSCNTILEINNRFGASQLVQFFNEMQGNVTSFIDASFSLGVRIPSRVDGDNVTMQTLAAVTNFAGTINLTSRTNGQTLSPGSFIAINLNTTLDYSTRKRYTVLTTASAIANPSGNQCKGSDFYAFVGGVPAAPSVPTAVPTSSPTITSAPTPDLSTAACEISADITCEVLRNNRTIGTCSRLLQDPAAIQCKNGNYPTSLSFIYRDARPSNVYVTVEDSLGTISNYTVVTNEIFTALGVFNDTVTITVYKLSNGGAGDLIQETTLDTSCEDPNVLRLGHRYGSIQLVGFENGGGSYTAVYPARISYIVRNGLIASTLETAYINSAFQLGGPFNAIPIPVAAKPREIVIVYREQTIIDASLKFGNGITYNFGMNTTATAQNSAKGCSAQYVMRV